jgi:hypothetical protein
MPLFYDKTYKKGKRHVNDPVLCSVFRRSDLRPLFLEVNLPCLH